MIPPTESQLLHDEIKRQIAEGHRLSEQAQAAAQADQDAAHKPLPAAAPPPPARQTLTLVPYTIVKALASLDNIYETRLFGWTLAKAQSVLKLYNKDLSEINIEHAMDLTRVTIPARLMLNDGDKNYAQVTKSFTLADKTIIYEKESRIYHLNIIAFPELRKDGRRSLVSFVIHNELWHALLDFSKGYRLFSLQTFMALQSKYSVIMYLLCTQQSQPKSYLVESLKILLGCSSCKAYDRGANFFARVIDPARDELIEKAPWYFNYTAQKEGRRHKYTNIVITPVLNPKFIATDTETTRTAARLRLGLDESVVHYLTEKFGMSAPDCERVEPLINKLGDVVAQLAKLEEIRHRTLSGRVKNPAGYLVRSLQNMFR